MSGLDVTAATNTSAFLNTINGLTASGATSPLVFGMRATGGTLVNLHRNKVYGLTASAAITTTAGAVNGIALTGGTTVNTFNNLIGGLTAPAAVLADAIRGIAVTSTTTSSSQNVYNNTVRLDASSTGATFGTTGVYQTGSATATTATLNLRNNIIINLSTPGATAGVVTALRRSATALLGNYGATSNKNLLYAGTPSATRTIMFDGTTAYQNIGPAATAGTYQNAVATRDAGSFTGEAAFDYSAVTGPTQFFQSITGSASTFLHALAGITTQVEGGADAITPLVALDFDGDTRTATPDVGGDEFVGVSPSPVITALSVPTQSCTAVAHVVTANVVPTSGTLTAVTLNYNNGAAGSVAMTLVSGNTYTGTIPAASPTNTTVTWSVSATNSIGTSASQSGTSYSDDPLFSVALTSTASANTVCAGTAVTLTGVLPASGTPGGASTTTEFEGMYRFGNGTNDFRHQYLYTAAELTAAGITAGNITSLTTNISSIGGGSANNYTIKMANSAATALTGTFCNRNIYNLFDIDYSYASSGRQICIHSPLHSFGMVLRMY